MSFFIFCSDVHFFGSSAALSVRMPISEVAAYGQHIVSESVARDVLCKLRKASTSSLYSWAVIPGDIKIKAAFFDMDGTVISGESLVELARISLAPSIREEIDLITQQAMNGHISFVPALTEKMAQFQGIKEKTLECISSQLKLNTGIQEWILSLHNQGIPSYLVTGGLKSQAVPVAQKLGMQGICANSAEWNNVAASSDDPPQWELTGRLVGKIIDEEAKSQYLIDICKSLDIPQEHTLVVGDGANDRKMAQTSGFSVGFHPKSALIPHLDAVNRSGHHGWIADLLCYVQSHR